VKASNGRKHKNKRLSTAKRNRNKQILPALVAVGGACGLATTPASALELGEITVDSSLGQPLRASIAYALNPNEQMFDFCIFLKPGMTANGIPTVSNARVTITDGAIVLNGRTPIREPMLAMQLSVNCPYTAHLARDYTLMIDPALPSEGEPAPLSNAAAPLTPVQTATVTASDIAVTQKPRPAVTRRARPQDDTPIAASSRYQVQPGDSLSQIAARIENRSIALWPAVEDIFAANPDAFLNNDRNLLKAGSWLVIPDMSGSSTVAATSDSSTVTQTTVAPDAASSASYTGLAVPETAALPAEAAETETASEAAAETAAAPAAITEPAPVVEPEVATATDAATPEMRPGDIIVGTDSPFVIPVGADEIVDIPDTAIDGPQVARPAPVVTSRETGDGSWSWLVWLGGAGLALIVGLLAFGRQLRERFGSVAVGAPAVPARRREDTPAPQPAVAELDYDFDGDTLNSRSITLDADLDAGTGLQDGSEMDVAQDFGFTATGATVNHKVDMEITEIAAREDESLTTDIIPPSERFRDTIVEDEILPSEDDAGEDYDLSMMVDATKQLLEDDDPTAKDLMAVAVQTDDGMDDDTNEYTLSKEVDYQILEQDYEDELTATQALNKEIEEAARALVERMDDVDVGDETAKMPSSEDPEKTAEMPGAADPEITAELTANLPASGDAQNEDFSDSVLIPELTAEMSVTETGKTIEMESGSIDTKKSKKAS
jgi:hypothetical protein